MQRARKPLRDFTPNCANLRRRTNAAVRHDGAEIAQKNKGFARSGAALQRNPREATSLDLGENTKFLPLSVKSL